MIESPSSRLGPPLLRSIMDGSSRLCYLFGGSRKTVPLGCPLVLWLLHSELFRQLLGKRSRSASEMAMASRERRLLRQVFNTPSISDLDIQEAPSWRSLVMRIPSDDSTPRRVRNRVGTARREKRGSSSRRVPRCTLDGYTARNCLCGYTNDLLPCEYILRTFLKGQASSWRFSDGEQAAVDVAIQALGEAQNKIFRSRRSERESGLSGEDTEISSDMSDSGESEVSVMTSE